MQRNRSHGNDSQSLARQISQVANRLDRRKKTAKSLGLLLGSRIRSGLASPGGLWFAGCAGFLAAEWIHRPEKQPPLQLRPAGEQATMPPSSSPTAAMSNSELLLRIALDLGTFWVKANAGGTRPDGRR